MYTSDTQADQHYLLLNNCPLSEITEFLIARKCNSHLWLCNYLVTFKNCTEDKVTTAEV